MPKHLYKGISAYVPWEAEESIAVRLSQQGWVWVDGEKVTGGGNVFSN